MRPHEDPLANVSLPVRHVAIFSIPILVAALLFYGTLPFRLEAFDQWAEWTRLALSPDEQVRAVAFASLAEGDPLRSSRWLGALEIGAVFVAGAAPAFLVPSSMQTAGKAASLTTMACGLCAAKIGFGFGYMNWPEFAVWAAASLFGSGMILQLWAGSAARPE